MLSGRAVLLQLFWTSVSCVLADDESSTQGKSENILESLERSMHPELMKVLCLQDHSPHPQLLLSSLSVRGVFYFLYLQLWWSRHQILVGSLLSHLSVSQMEPHGLRLHVPHLQVWLWHLPAFSFSIATSLYCQCFASAHVSQRQPEKELFCFDSVLSQDRVLASLWPGTNINAFLCLSMEEKQIN